MFRKQILAELRKRNPGVSEKVLGLIADKLVGKVTAEDQIEGVIDELDNSPISIADYADFLQKEGDRRVSEAQRQKPKGGNNPESSTETEEEPSTEIGKLTKMISDLSNTVTGLVKEKKTQSIQSQMEGILKEKGISKALLKGRVPETEEEIENVIAEIEADWKEIHPNGAPASTGGTPPTGIGAIRKPGGGSGSGGDDKPKVSEAILDFAKKNTERAKTSKETN